MLIKITSKSAGSLQSTGVFFKKRIFLLAVAGRKHKEYNIDKKHTLECHLSYHEQLLAKYFLKILLDIVNPTKK